MALRPARHQIAPWFHRWPAATVGVAATLYATIFVLRLTTGTPSEATMLLLVLPIALLAVTFGQFAGLIGALVAVGLVVAWAVTGHVELSPVGWAARALPLLLLGLLLGRAADRLRASESDRARLDSAAHWHRQAVEINDSIVQGLSAANRTVRWTWSPKHWTPRRAWSRSYCAMPNWRQGRRTRWAASLRWPP